jgi:2,4-dienoyl-CoA reductase-like NADH-dependent reductase (Old Yellow Enzyme family)/thioredoxin reductase
MREATLDILFEPLRMSNLSLKNRFFMAPIGTHLSIDQWKDFLAARARGGVALITTGEICVHVSGKASVGPELSLETDDDIPVFIPVVKAVQEGGARIVAQLNHAGRYSFGKLLGRPSVAPSPIASRYTGETPRELTTGEADDLVIAFAEAAVRARKAGFDGIELLGCSGYLISQFLSPLTNQRTDRYGGDTIGRATFLFSILQETRKRVGSDFNICVKFDAEDSMPGGKTLPEALMLAPLIVSAGADRLHIWAGWHEATRPMLPMSVPRGAFSYLAAAIKAVVDVPVSTVGRINDPYVAADILQKGQADLIGLGRALMCDPDFVKKTLEGRTREIRRCIACCYCFDILRSSIRGSGDPGTKCALNPELGHEGEGLSKPAPKRKRVLIAGGGPAGLEVSRLAALRGHEVILMEKSYHLGGMIHLAARPPYKNELKNVIEYYTAMMNILPINVHLNKSLTFEAVKQLSPDVVVLATGAEALIPPLTGVDKKHVFTALQVLNGEASVGRRVVIIGGGLIGLETAEFLSDQGKEVTVVEMLKQVAADVGPSTRWGFIARISEKMTLLTSMQVVEVKEKSVVVADLHQSEKEIPADTVVIAVGLISSNGLRKDLEQSDIKSFVVGSGKTPGLLAQVLSEAFEVGCQI